MAQEIINTGAAANDGTGDPLRTAFIKTDNNFDQIWAAGPVGTNVQISGNTITTLQVNQDLVLSPNGVANVRINNNTVPNANNIWYLGSVTNRWRGLYVGNVVAGNITISNNLVVPGDMTVGGNLTIEGDTIQIGNIVTDTKTIQLANTAATDAAADGSGITVGASDNIATLLYNSTDNEWRTNIGANIAGNLLANTVEFTGELTVARRIVVGTLPSGNIEILDDTSGNGPAMKTPGGSGLDLLIEPSGNLYLTADGGEVIVTDQTPSVNSATGALRILGGIGVNGNVNAGENIAAVGNITANYFVGNGSQLTGIASTYGNANVADYLPTYTGNISGNSIDISGNLVVARTIRIGTLPSGNLEILDDTSGNGPAIKTPGGSGLDIVIEPSGNLYLNADGGEVIVSDQTPSVDSSTGALLVLGGIGVNGNINAGGNISAAGWAGNLIPSANAVYSLGNATNYWSNLWVANNTIYIGGVPLGVTGNTLTVNGESVTGNITFTDTTMSPPDGVDITISAANSEVIVEAFDIRLDATDDLRLIGNDIVSLRNRSTTDPVTIITDYDNTETTWTFSVDGTLTTPGDIVVAGDVTGTAGANTLVLKAQPASNTLIQLNSIVDSVISTVANLEIRTDVSNTAKTWEFDTTGDFTAPGNITANYFLGNGSQLTDVNAVTVDVTDTNGLTTIYYPTFVENRTTGQIARADVDLTYRTDDNVLTVGNVSVTGNITGNTAGFAIGYRDIPQVAFTGNTTIAATDAGKHFYSTQSTDYILTIANNASQGFQTGAAITVVNQGTGNITVAQGSGVTLYLAGNATSGNRTVSTFGMATIMKVATDTWFINGTGVA